MNVISDAGSIRSGIVIAKNVEMRSLADNYLLDIGEKIVRMHQRLITKKICLVSTTGVEISQ